MSKDIAAFAAFWAYYQARRADILGRTIGRSTALSRFHASQTPEQRELFGPAVVRAAERAIADGTFAPLDAHQRRLGQIYAQAGLQYGDVFAGLSDLRTYVLEVMDAEHNQDPAITRGLLLYILHAVLHMGGAFIDKRDQLVLAQQRQILELSVPVLTIREHVLLVPLIGELVAERIAGITPRVLGEVNAQRARQVILDFTGLAHVDATAANVLGELVAAAGIMGARTIVCGLSSELANTMVDNQIDLDNVEICHDLAEAVARC